MILHAETSQEKENMAFVSITCVALLVGNEQ